MKRMDALTSEKAAIAITTQAMDARMTYEVCGDTVHSGNYCPTTQEDVMYMNGNNNGYRTQGGQAWNQSRHYYREGNQTYFFNPNQHSLRDLVFRQAKINGGFNKKTTAYDKALESLNVKIDSLSSALNNQLSFNKMIETQLAQLDALVPCVEDGKIPGQPVSSCENVCAVSTRWGKPYRGHEPLTMQGDLYNRFLIHGNLQQLCTRKTMVIRLSLAQYTIRKLGMLSVILARVLTSCPRGCSKDWDILLLLQPRG
jgi:hypothetical protein